jgi:hypothetical protein
MCFLLRKRERGGGREGERINRLTFYVFKRRRGREKRKQKKEERGGTSLPLEIDLILIIYKYYI